jgi:hypothetical protein
MNIEDKLESLQIEVCALQSLVGTLFACAADHGIDVKELLTAFCEAPADTSAQADQQGLSPENATKLRAVLHRIDTRKASLAGEYLGLVQSIEQKQAELSGGR